MEKIIEKIRQELKENFDKKTKDSQRHYFKEEIKSIGVKTVVVERIEKENFAAVKNLPKIEIFKLCELFWQSGYIEESFIACNWAYKMHEQFIPDDFKIFENWINRYVSNWASCDTLCNHTVGEFLMRYPDYISKLKKMAHSDNRWMRRASAVSLIIPARKGMFLKDILEIADILLMDKDDLVQKGYGWMLKVASQTYQEDVFNYIMSKKAVMPRTALRYAIEKMPEELRKEAMKK